MSREVVSRIESLVTDVQSAIESLQDDMFLAQFRLGAGMLANSVHEAGQSLNAARVNDIDFALSDLIQIADGLSASDSEKLRPPLQLLQQEVRNLKKAVSLAPEVIARIRDFQSKLRIRRSAIERQTYRPPGSAAEPLPHEPRQLRLEAEGLIRDLAAAGFISPMLDQFVSDPDSIRLHQLSATIDELDVMVGSAGTGE